MADVSTPTRNQCPCYRALGEVLTHYDPAHVIGLIQKHRFNVTDLRRAAATPELAHETNEYTPVAAAVAAARGDLPALQFFFGVNGCTAQTPEVKAAFPAAYPHTFVLPPYSAQAYHNACLYHAARNGHAECVAYLLAPDGARLTPDDAADILEILEAEAAEASAATAAAAAAISAPAGANVLATNTPAASSTLAAILAPTAAGGAIPERIAQLLKTGGTPEPVCYVNSDEECVCDAPHDD